MVLSLILFTTFISHPAHVEALFFGGGGGGGCGGCACGMRRPVCPPVNPCQYQQRPYSYNAPPQYHSYASPPIPSVSYRAPPPFYQHNTPYQVAPLNDFGYTRSNGGYVGSAPLSVQSYNPNPTKVQVTASKGDKELGASSSSSSSSSSSPSDNFGDTSSNTVIEKIVDKPTEIKNDLDLDDINSLANFENTIETYKMQTRGGVRRSQEEKCSSLALKMIIYEAMSPDNVSISKLRISQKAKKVFGYNFDVICSEYDFSYLISSNIFCRVEKKGQICLAYEK